MPAHAAGAAHHLLGQGVALAGVLGDGREAEDRGGRQAQGLAGLGGEAAADDEGDAAAGADLVEDHVGLHLELGDDLAVLQGLALVGAQLDDVAHVHAVHVQLDGQGAGSPPWCCRRWARSWRPGRRRRSACWARRGCPRP